MELQLHTLSPSTGSKKKRKRIGRGLGSSHGTYATRGMKGQRSRSGGSKGLKRRGLRDLMRQVPKLGGFKSKKQAAVAISLTKISELYRDGETVSLKTLAQKGYQRLRTTPRRIKILTGEAFSRKLVFEACEFSSSARDMVEQSGSTIR